MWINTEYGGKTYRSGNRGALVKGRTRREVAEGAPDRFGSEPVGFADATGASGSLSRIRPGFSNPSFEPFASRPFELTSPSDIKPKKMLFEARNERVRMDRFPFFIIISFH
jgi:hypothetical protein